MWEASGHRCQLHFGSRKSTSVLFMQDPQWCKEEEVGLAARAELVDDLLDYHALTVSHLDLL